LYRRIALLNDEKIHENWTRATKAKPRAIRPTRQNRKNGNSGLERGPGGDGECGGAAAWSRTLVT